jgi:MerR family transcriptional regulator, heat shock protein HspR
LLFGQYLYLAKKLIFINVNFHKINMNSGNDDPLYTISTAAKLLEISVHTLRMYEREGLIVPFKKESNHRLYSRSDIQRLICIRKAINIEKLSIAGIQTIFSMIPCWSIKGCSHQDQLNCLAFSSFSKPCWMINHKNNICENQVCRECIVYKNYPECGKIKESIVHLFENQ